MPAISVAGFASCPYHQQALAAAQKLVELGEFDAVEDLTKANRDLYQQWLRDEKPALEDDRAATHTSSPFVFSGETFIGGCDDTLALLAESQSGRSPQRRLGALAQHIKAAPTAAEAPPLPTTGVLNLPLLTPDQGQIPTRPLPRVGVDLPIIGFAGFGLTHERTQEECNQAVEAAVKIGATYMDVAPNYGNGTAQTMLGPALAPFRDRCILSCKTAERDAAGARRELEESLQLLQTDYFDIYQCHGVTDDEQVDTILGPGGALEAFKEARAEGKVKYLGFSAHDEDAALRMVASDEFDT